MALTRSLLSEENMTGLYVAIPVYFCCLAVVAWLSSRTNSKQLAAGEADHVTSHFLAGRSFGPVITAGTVFASLFSGYTVVGIPNEAFAKGFYAFRWMPSFAFTAVTTLGTGVRLRKASIVRNHHTPVDFITDRFGSQTLRYSILIIQVLASIVYLAAQVNAINSTFNSMFNLPSDQVGPTIGIFAILLLFEWVGGLRTIALSDSFQGMIMLCSFIMIPSIIKKNFGGWKDIDPTTYPRPDFYQTPSAEQQWALWQFSLINVCFFALPHLMMRLYAARDLRSLKAGWAVMTVGPWMTMFVGVFIGTVGVQMLWDGGGESNEAMMNPTSPFTAILEEIINLGGFAKGAGIIALTSSLAAIMSTADSLIIALSQLITVECIWPFQSGEKPQRIAWIGRFMSLVFTALAVLMGLLWKGGVSALSAINFPIMIQAVPAFIIGLYGTELGEFHPRSLAIGAWVGLVYVFLFFFIYTYQNPTANAVNSGITGVILNIAATMIAEKLSGHIPKPDWDAPSHERFGEAPLTAALLDDMMVNFPEPLRNGWFVLAMFVAVTIVTPLVAESQPALIDDGTAFVSSPSVVNGLPWWFFKQILICLIPYGMALFVLWTTPTEYPFDEEKIDQEGINPEIIELTSSEMNHREAFDSPMSSVRLRRSTISIKMDELGLSSKEEKPRPPMEKRLSSMIQRRGTVSEEKSETEV